MISDQKLAFLIVLWRFGVFSAYVGACTTLIINPFTVLSFLISGCEDLASIFTSVLFVEIIINKIQSIFRFNFVFFAVFLKFFNSNKTYWVYALVNSERTRKIDKHVLGFPIVHCIHNKQINLHSHDRILIQMLFLAIGYRWSHYGFTNDSEIMILLIKITLNDEVFKQNTVQL